MPESELHGLPAHVVRALKSPKRDKGEHPAPPAGNPWLTASEQRQEALDEGVYQTLAEQIDEWHYANGWLMPDDVLREIVERQKSHLAGRMAAG